MDNFYKTFVSEKSMFHLFTFKNLQNHLNQFTQTAKQNFFTKVATDVTDLF